jgi:hypothetical protein
MTDMHSRPTDTAIPVVRGNTAPQPAVASPGDTVARLNGLLQHSQCVLYIHIGKAAYRVKELLPFDDQFLLCVLTDSEVVRALVRWDHAFLFYLVGSQPFTL